MMIDDFRGSQREKDAATLRGAKSIQDDIPGADIVGSAEAVARALVGTGAKQRRDLQQKCRKP